MLRWTRCSWLGHLVVWHFAAMRRALHLLHKGKHLVRVYDYVDDSVPVLSRMYENRLKAYKAVGYAVQQLSTKTLKI
jgi:hypothetical protein